MYQRLCDTQIQKRGNIVLFTHYSQRNAPNRRPYRPKAINVRGKEVHDFFFHRYGREKGPYRKAVLSSAKRVYVRISVLSSIKSSFLYGVVGAPTKQSDQNARTVLRFLSTSVKNGPKTTTKPRIQNQCKIIFCTGMGDTTATNWMPVYFEGKSATAVSSYSNRRGARKEST